MPFLIPYITLKSIYNFSHVFKIPYHLFARILLLQPMTTPPPTKRYIEIGHPLEQTQAKFTQGETLVG